jgi:HEAT repeat protein
MEPDLSRELEAALESEESGALAGLARSGRPDVIEALRAVVRDPAAHTAFRRRALWALGLTGKPEIVADIAAALPGLDEKARIAAIDALGRIATDDALRIVERYTNDAAPQVRKFVVQALARMSGPEATDRLQEMAGRDAEPWIRALAARQLSSRRSQS